MDGGSSPAREGSAGALSEGTFSQVLLQTFVSPLVQCVLCVCSPLALLLPLLLECSHRRERGPSFSRGRSVCAGLCWLLARVRCCWQKKKVVVSLHQRKLLLQGRSEERGGVVCVFLSKSAISLSWDMEIAAGKGSGAS